MTINITVPENIKAWQTTFSALLAAAAFYVTRNPADFAKWPWVDHLATFIVSGGIATLGYYAAVVNKPSAPPAP
jgi:hypothetical protein